MHLIHSVSQSVMLSDMGFRGWHSVVSFLVQYFEFRPFTNRILKKKFSKFYHIIFCTLQGHLGARGGAVGWGTALQAGKVTDLIPDSVIGVFRWHSPSGCTMALALTHPLTEMSTGNSSWGWRQLVHRADDPTTFMCQLSWNLGASTSWNLQGLSRPVMGLLCLFYKGVWHWSI